MTFFVLPINNKVCNSSQQCALSIGNNGKYVEELANTEVTGLRINNHQNWKNHIHQMIPKLSGACYAVRYVFHIVNICTPKSICIVYVHFVMK